MSPPTILLVEDDAAIAFMLNDVLESTGYQVRQAATGAAARAALEQVHPDLIILDLVLLDEDGLVLCSVLKNLANVPIVICSGTQRRRDAFLSLKLGADDFIAKPFDVYDLLARVEVLLRRAAQHHANDAGVARGPIRIGDLTIDHGLHQVSLAGTLLQLTPTEYRLLTVLAARPDQVVPRAADHLRARLRLQDRQSDVGVEWRPGDAHSARGRPARLSGRATARRTIE
jgi:DNA-binding response OmpR family regulator